MFTKMAHEAFMKLKQVRRRSWGGLPNVFGRYNMFTKMAHEAFMKLKQVRRRSWGGGGYPMFSADTICSRRWHMKHS